MKLKQKINNLISQKKSDDSLLIQIADIKSKIVNKKIFDSNTYNQLSDVEHSLYRYNNFIKHNLTSEANNEAQKLSTMVKNLDSQPTILYGSVSNTQYVWHTEPNACETCQELDGTVYDNKDDVPAKPHPNCKYSVEEVEDTENNPNPKNEEDSEPCDCVKELDAVIEELENVINEAESLANTVETDINEVEEDLSKVKNLITDAEETLKVLDEDLGKHLPDCENNIDNAYAEIYATKAELQTLLSDILGLMLPLVTLLNVVRIFVSNYIALLHEAYILKQAGMDKYRHSKANCEAAQQSGILGSMTATALSDLKEYYDQYTYVNTHKVSIKEAIADSERDQVANRLGRERGRKYPYCSCSILMDDLKPDFKK